VAEDRVGESGGVPGERLSLSFYGTSDVNVWVSFGMTLLFLLLCVVAVGWIFRTGYRLKS